MQGRGRRLRIAMVGLALLLVSLLAEGTSEARLHPYYVLTGVSFGQQKPRILFVLDTSGSMTWRAKAGSEICDWDKCEGGSGTEQSKIHAARTAIRGVVEETAGVANFGLMTFDQLRPPTANGSIPTECKYGNADYRRFRWFSQYRDSWNWWQNADLYGYAGAWQLCGANRPYPYLRWDDLGRGSVINADDQQGDVPPSPLISTAYADFSHADNSKRKVQWFPEFLGVRVNLNDDTDPNQAILGGTWGDYGVNDNERKSKVWKRDFYYWPYVDGFPGYTFHYGNGVGQLGVVGEDNSLNAGSLYAPFFLESAVKNFKQEDIGPKSIEEATDRVLAMTDSLPNGGVDATGGTPWKSVVGPIIQAPPQTNGVFSHSTIASYLRFTRNIDKTDLCVPLAAVLVTDGDPSPAQEGGSGLHSRLSDLRTELDARVYVVGFLHGTNSLNNMACAAAGSDDNFSPCNGTPKKNWDTCFDPDNPKTKCAFLANSAEELAETLTTIVEGELALDVGAGPGSSVNDFGVGAGGKVGEGETVQTTVEGYTEWPGWRGHVVRDLCEDIDPDTLQLAEYCKEQPFDEPEEEFGPCAQSRAWDAGECLQQTAWKDRRLYMNDKNNVTFRIIDQNGEATGKFVDALNDPALDIPGAPFDQAGANAVAAFIQGKDWPDGWKLPGLATSAPIVVRRIPKRDEDFAPSVGIRDPHCAGRKLNGIEEVDDTLVDFADEAWDENLKLQLPSEHYEYQEAVIVGDDLGVLHAFQFDSGNELWGLMPRFMLANAVESYANGTENMGQPDKLDDHVYGLGGTLNHGWVHDEDLNGGNGGWRHYAIIGAGNGGKDLMALDLSHMSPVSPDGPIEILWTTQDVALAPTYDKILGETWARPALSYQVPNDQLSDLPDAYVVFGSGYPDQPATDAYQGRTLVWADALTGKIKESAKMPAPTAPVYDSWFGAVVDPAIGTHCVSRYWGEMQEMYINDPAGRLYRWDLGRETNHDGDSGQEWNGAAYPVATFRACQGQDDLSCSVTNTNKAEPFAYSPAVVSNDRIDDEQGFSSGDFALDRRDKFMVAMISGSVFDDAIDGGTPTNDFHSSIYLLADDHKEETHKGFAIPNGGGKTQAGTHKTFFRLALSDIERTRTFTPFPGSDTYEETRVFSKAARPIRAPKIKVTGLLEDGGQNQFEVVPNVEVYYVEYVIYEPGDRSCDQRWYDPEAEEWVFDEGSTYTIRLRLTVKDGEGYDFINGAGVDFADGYGMTGAGLSLGKVEQHLDGDCEDGVCGPSAGTDDQTACDPNATNPPETDSWAVGVSHQEIEGFTPLEIPLP